MTLRDWNIDTNQPLIDALMQFGLEAESLLLLKYECLTPDSFIWFFGIGNAHYCLYAEDYVPSLEHVVETINVNRVQWTPEATFELMEVVKPAIWEESSPVTSATTYQPPEDTEEFMKFAAASGVDFVFLARAQ